MLSALNQHVPREQKLDTSSIFLFCDTTDAGSDQASRRRHMKAAVAGLDSLLFIDANCILHQFHLIVKDSLLLVDQFLGQLKESHPDVTCGFEAYLSNLAKAVNFWRSHVPEFIDSWEAVHGFGKCSDRTRPDPVKYRRFPLAVISGRWGSVESSEQFFLERSRALLEPVYMAVLSKYMKSTTAGGGKAVGRSSKRAAAASGEAADEPRPGNQDLLGAEDDRQHYRMKMTKWADGAMKTVRSTLFWLFLAISSRVRSPLNHFFAWCQKNSDERLIQQLVMGKAQAFQDEFGELLSTFDSWFDEAVTEAAATGLPSDVLELVRTLSFRMVVHAAGSFYMRITMHIQAQGDVH